MRKTEVLAYTAGIMDGEGSIYIRRTDARQRTSSMAVFVTNTEEWICQWLKFRYGGSVQLVNKNKPARWKVGYRWWITSNQALSFLKLILPYLNLKRPQVELAIKFQEQKLLRAGRKLTDTDKVLIEADRILMKQLNKRGT